MNTITPTEFNPSLAVIHGQIKTTSLKIAEHFGKQHCNVIKAIKSMGCSPEFTALHFNECQRINKLANGKPEPYYEITRDGFMFLAMGFTGKEAAKWKEAYINAFNAMAEQIYKTPYGLKEASKTQQERNTPIQQLVEEKVRKILQSEFLPKEQASVTIMLAPLASGMPRRWIVSQVVDEGMMMYALTPEEEVMSKEQFIAALIQDGYIVIKKTEVLERLSLA